MRATQKLRMELLAKARCPACGEHGCRGVSRHGPSARRMIQCKNCAHQFIPDQPIPTVFVKDPNLDQSNSDFALLRRVQAEWGLTPSST